MNKLEDIKTLMQEHQFSLAMYMLKQSPSFKLFFRSSSILKQRSIITWQDQVVS